MEEFYLLMKMEFFVSSFLFVLLFYTLLCDASSDSILNMINTEEVEKYLIQKKENSTKEKRLLLFHNALEDGEVSSATTTTYGNTFPPTTEKFIKPYFLPMQQFTPRRESTKTLKPFDTHTVGIDVLMRNYNDSFPYSSTDLLSDLSGFRGNKVLKSSKNALFVTTKNYLKSDWCKTEPLVQKIRQNGCLTRTVINRFCYGQCNSFYIPKNPRRRRSQGDFNNDDFEETGEIGEVAAAFKSCAFCKPKRASWITVTLFCPSMKQQRIRKRIQRIKQCKCIAIVYN